VVEAVEPSAQFVAPGVLVGASSVQVVAPGVQVGASSD
jgi:hypothetical protein